MVLRDEVILRGPETALCDGRVLASFRPDIAGRPVDVTFLFGGDRVVKPGFASQSMGSERSEWQPVVEVMASGDVRMIIGAVECLVLGTNGRVRTIALFRSRDEDGGFYTVDFLEVPDGLMMVYESGVCLIDGEGNPRWHVRKCWDDVLAFVDAAEARFLEGDDAAFSIDLGTGQRSVRARGGGADE